MDNEKIENDLENILSYLNDSYKCYNDHKQSVSNDKLRQLFDSLGQHRAEMIKDIKNILQRVGGDPDKSGTFLGAAHRLYENLKTLVTQGDPVVITKEIKRGENILIESYKEALQKHPSADIEQKLRQHVSEIEDELKEADMLSIGT